MYFDSIWPLLCPGVLYLEDTVSGLGTSGMYYHDFQASSEIAISGRPHILVISVEHYMYRNVSGFRITMATRNRVKSERFRINCVGP